MPPAVTRSSTVEELLAQIMARPSKPRLLAIDGLPCSGKTTLAERPADIRPGFPFPFFRTEEISAIVQSLARGAVASFHPYDWETERLTTATRELAAPLIVEGCSVLCEDLAPLFDVRIWVESDAATLRAAQRARDGDRDADVWDALYLPSVERWMQTEPWRRADVFVAGRDHR